MTLLLDQPIKYLALAALGLLLRILTTTNFKETLRHRVEVVTPMSDWKRVYEAIHLWNSGLDPYGGNLFHEYPISLQFYKIVSNYFDVDLAFVITDTITAILLHQSIYRQLLSDNETEKDSRQRSTIVYLVYLFSPLTIISCAGQSTIIFTNFLIASILFTLPIKTFKALTCVLCALLACNNIYYATLILPIFVCMEYSSWVDNLKRTNITDRNTAQGTSSPEGKKPNYYSNANFLSTLTNSAIICLASIATLLITSYVLMGNSWSYMKSSYLFILKVGDLTPNVGIYWYFFTEMFDHFLSFFTWVIQILAYIQVIPLTIALRDRPFFALYIVALISTICQPYPSLANIGLVTSILPQYSDLFQHLARGLKVVCTCVTCMCLWPIFWHLWIIMGTANANFYFGATLAFMAALIFFSIDLLNAHVYKMTKLKLQQYDEEKKAYVDGSSNRQDAKTST